MYQVKIEKNIKLEEVEELYATLYRFTNADKIVDLILPSELSNNSLVLIPSLYQYVITWMRLSNGGKLLLDIEKPEETDFEKLYDNEFYFPIVSLLWSKNNIYNRSGTINLRKYLKPQNTRIHNSMEAVQALKGWRLLLVNFDHFPENLGILPCFEINGTFLQNESTLSKNLKKGLEGVLSFSKDSVKVYDHYKDPLLGITYELMKNTFEWGKEDENRVPLDPSMRGILIKFYKKTRTKLQEEFKNIYGLNEFFKADTHGYNSNQELFFLEIDVFDSGVGFINKYKSLNNDTTLTDIEILKACMIKHVTSDKGLSKEDKGIGLDRILDLLNNKGFLRIRTGNLCVYRNLISNPYKNINKEKASEMELFDWKKDDSRVYTKFEQAQGSVITIIYPLAFNYNE